MSAIHATFARIRVRFEFAPDFEIFAPGASAAIVMLEEASKLIFLDDSRLCLGIVLGFARNLIVLLSSAIRKTLSFSFGLRRQSRIAAGGDRRTLKV